MKKTTQLRKTTKTKMGKQSNKLKKQIIRTTRKKTIMKQKKQNKTNWGVIRQMWKGKTKNNKYIKENKKHEKTTKPNKQNMRKQKQREKGETKERMRTANNKRKRNRNEETTNK